VARLQRKVEQTLALAADRGLDLRRAPLLATFEMPVWGASLAAHEIGEMARLPLTAVAVTSQESLPQVRRALEGCAPHLHAIAERGLVCGLSGGRTLDVYPSEREEMEAFASALFANVAEQASCFSLSGCVSSGRQEAVLTGMHESSGPNALELQHAIRRHGGSAALAGDRDEFVVIDDLAHELGATREALNSEFPGRPVRVTRLPSGRFRLQPGASEIGVEAGQAHSLAQRIAMDCDRFVDARGRTTFGFVTEPVARREYGPEQGARRLAREHFDRPDTVVTHLGLAPFIGEGTLFFAYEGSETVLDAAQRGIHAVAVRDIMEYARILEAIRRGE
jgi:hypothetical protein